jgi:[lysine-biosynthesis-protein LysW]---L-2-aminoadipate ligase
MALYEDPVCANEWPMRLALIALRTTTTNESITDAVAGGARWELMTPEEALGALRPGDVALGRLDVLPTLDGIDDGVWALGALEARRVCVLNDASALYATHDKLLTARLLRRFAVPHPRTVHVRPDRPFAALRPPVVVKPRFGSGGNGVTRCDDEAALVDTLALLSDTPWFEEQGVLVQELVPPRGYDLRILVAAERVVGAVFRIAAAGEWRTNIALGGVRRPVWDPPQDACALALAAAHAAGASLVGVDLVPDADGNWTVIELNGAVEFTHEYQPAGDVFADVASELGRHAVTELAALESTSTAA